MDEVGKQVGGILKTVADFAKLGQAGWIGAGVLTVIAVVAGIYLARASAKARQDEANKKTDQGRVDAGSQVPDEGRKVEQDGNSAADQIDHSTR
jgi:hypothetical protein